jgi:hypothetical protein
MSFASDPSQYWRRMHSLRTHFLNWFNVQEKEVVVVDIQDLTVGSHEPFAFREDLSFLEGGLVTAYTKGPGETNNNILIGSSKGNIYSISWDKLGSSDQSLQMTLNIVYKTNPVGTALYYGQIRCNGSEHGTLFVSGEMCDGAIYLVNLSNALF